MRRLTPPSSLLALPLALLCGFATLSAQAEARLSKEEVLQLLKKADDEHRVGQDLKILVYMEERYGEQKVFREAVLHHREAESKMMLLFVKPRTEAGSGYLRMEANLWFYDASVGRWERRTDRERIGNTNVRRSDFADVPLWKEYDAEDGGVEMLGKLKTRKILLTAKPGIDVAFPKRTIWLDEKLNSIKTQDFALSGKLLRTSLAGKPVKVFSEAKKRDIWFPSEIRIFDEIEKGRTTVLLFKTFDVRPLASNLFTKAWLESKSR